jgi:hypothetical protein
MHHESLESKLNAARKKIMIFTYKFMFILYFIQYKNHHTHD